MKVIFVCTLLAFLTIVFLPHQVFAASGSLNVLGILTGTTAAGQFGYPNTPRPMTVADVNEDGYADILVGARYHSPSGRSFLFLGGSQLGNLSASEAHYSFADDLVSTPSQAAMGEGLATGDINGDGHLEFLVSDYRYDATAHDEGAVFIFPTGPGVSSKNASQASARVVGTTLRETVLLANVVGDVNGDGKDDFLVVSQKSNQGRFHLFFGSSTLENKTVSQADVTYFDTENYCYLEYSVPGRSDINGDGYDDIVIGCAYSGGFQGRIYIILGGPNITSRNIEQADIILGGSSGLLFGTYTEVGDLNNDGLDDIIAVEQSKVYVFFGQRSPTNKNLAQADLTYSIDPSDSACSYINSAYIADVNNDAKSDVILSSEACGKLYVIYGSDSLQSKTLAAADLVYSGPSNELLGSPMAFADMNNDGYTDIIASAGKYNNKQGRVYMLSVPNGSGSNAIADIGNTGSLSLTGNVSDVSGIGGVEMKLNADGWQSCTVTGSAYSCSLPSSTSDGAHRVQIRRKNTAGVYSPSSQYASAQFTLDRTAPQTTWTDTSGKRKEFASLGTANVLTTDQFPVFEFSPASDPTSGVTKYQVVLDGQTYLDNISPDAPSGNATREDEDKIIQYHADKITVQAKNEAQRLKDGQAYKWSVRAIDRAGNTLSTGEKILRVNTRQAVFSGVYFPLSLLQLDGRSTSLTTTQPTTTQVTLTASSQLPVFYGITPVGAKVTLRLHPSQTPSSVDDILVTATADGTSRFLLTPAKALEKVSYTAYLSAENDQGDYVELAPFTLVIETAKASQKTPLASPTSVSAAVLGAFTSLTEKQCIWVFCWK